MTSHKRKSLKLTTSETSRKLNVLWLNGNTLGMDGSQVGVLEERDEVSFGSFLKSTNSGRLETEISLEILSNLTNETLEANRAKERVSFERERKS